MRYLLLCLLTTTIVVTSAQEETYMYEYIDYRGDTVELITITDPTVCDCIKKDYRNEDQQAICDKKFDYDFMTEEEQNEFDVRAQICRNPSVCDCALADMNDRGLVKQCDKEYRQNWHSDSRKEEILKEMRDCEETDLSYHRLIKTVGAELEICDCINIGQSEYKKRRECDEKFFDTEELSEEEIEQNNTALQKCIENNEFSIDPTLCECADFAATDEQFKKACEKKFDTSSMTPKQVKDYDEALALCKDLRFYERLNQINDSLALLEADSSQVATEVISDFEAMMEDAMAEMEFEMQESIYEAIEGGSWNSAFQKPKVEYGKLKEGVQNKIYSTARYTVCQCSQVKEHRKYLIQECPEYFRLDALSTSELSTLREMSSKCDAPKAVETICDCLEIPEGDKTDAEKARCEEWLAPLTPQELIKYMNGSTTCE